MKKNLLLFLLTLAIKGLFGQQPVMSITNNTGTYTITCTTPSLNFIASVSPTTTPLTYTWFSQNASYTGSNVIITAAGIYTLTGLDPNTNLTLTQAFTISSNTFAPYITMLGPSPVITCSTPSAVLSGYGTTGTPPGAGFPGSLPVVCSSWYGPGILTPTLTGCSYTAFVQGTYTLTVKDLNNGCTATGLRIVGENRIFPSVTLPQVFNIKCPNATAVIFPTVVGNPNAYTYSWTPPTGAVVSSVTTPSITVDSPGDYKVVITDPSNGCTVIWYVSVEICVGIKEIESVPLTISPNPTRGYFSLSLRDNEAGTLQIFNAGGSLVMQILISAKDPEINMHDLPEGLYSLRWRQRDRSSRYVKLVKLASE